MNMLLFSVILIQGSYQISSNSISFPIQPLTPLGVGLQRIVPSAQLLVPPLLELHVEVLLGVRQYAHLGEMRCGEKERESRYGSVNRGLEENALCHSSKRQHN